MCSAASNSEAEMVSGATILRNVHFDFPALAGMALSKDFDL
jgi:hypothetical protein